MLNHHQVALCDELYRQLGEGFRFVETGNLNNDRKLMGFTQFERLYRLKATECKDEARRLAMSADVAIMGAESYPFLKLRLSSTNKVTFSYSERWLKQGWKNLLSPNLLKAHNALSHERTQTQMVHAVGRRASCQRSFQNRHL